MKLFNSRSLTLAAAAAIVVVGGGATAHAGGLLDGGDIRNNSITAKDLDANSVKAGELAPNSVDETSLQNDSVTTENLTGEAETAVETVITNADPGSMVTMWTDETCRAAGASSACSTVTSQGTSDMMVYLDVQNVSDKPVKVGLNNGEMFCVADPGGSCQSARRLVSTSTFSVDGWGSGANPEGVDIQVNVVRSPLN